MCKKRRGSDYFTNPEKIDRFDEADAYNVLGTVNMWINNADSKASVSIAVIGIASTVFLTTDLFGFVCTVVKNSFNLFHGWVIFYCLFLWFSLISMVVGVLFFLRVIMPRIIKTYKTTVGQAEKKVDFPSIMFYGSIANKSFDGFYNEVLDAKKESIIKDLCFQIHSSSRICLKKFRNLQLGLTFLIVGIVVFIIQLIIYGTILA